MMCWTLNIPVLAMNLSSGFIGTFVLVMDSKVVCSCWLTRSLARSVFAGSFWHLRRMCSLLMRLWPHGHVSAGFSGLESTAVSLALRRAMAMAVRRGRLAVMGFGCFLGFLNSLCCVCHWSKHWWCELLRSHKSVVLVHGHFVFLCPTFTSVSAHSLSMIPVCDGSTFL